MKGKKTTRRWLRGKKRLRPKHRQAFRAYSKQLRQDGWKKFMQAVLGSDTID